METIIALSMGLGLNVALLLLWWLKLARHTPVVDDVKVDNDGAGMSFGGADAAQRRKRSGVQGILAQPLLDYLIGYWGYFALTIFIWIISLFATTVALAIADPAIRASVQDFFSFLQAVQGLIVQTIDALTFNAFMLTGDKAAGFSHDVLLRLEWFSFGALTGLMAAKLVGEFLRGTLLVGWYVADPYRLVREFKYPGAERGLFTPSIETRQVSDGRL